MPFDGKNFTETKPDVFSLEGLIAWLEKQPARKRYCYHDNGGCLLHRYFAASGLPVAWTGSLTWKDRAGGEHLIPGHFDDIANGFDTDTGVFGAQTYGAALQRARARALQAR